MSLTIQGLLVLILGMFIDNTELVNSLASDLIILGGIVLAWYGRYRQGDIDIAGFRK